LIAYSFHPDAEAELADAADYYEARRPGLGKAFAGEVTRTISLIREHPDAGSPVGPSRRLIPANCYYEWKELPVGKRPYCIRLEDESPFFIGGMWDVWHAREEDRLYTFTVLTTFPNEVSGTVHDRMPVIVQPKDYQRWLDPENQDVADIIAPRPPRAGLPTPSIGGSTARRTTTRS
jgi:putative SOS response-associated peptidase YedK